jgi:hypothetical protein
MTSEFSTDDVLSSPVFSSHSAQPIWVNHPIAAWAAGL